MDDNPDLVSPPRLFRSLLAFGLVGLTSTLVHVSVGLSLVGAGLADPLTANFLAFCVAFGVSYVGHRRWSFASKAAHRRSLPRFLAVALFALALNQAIVWVLVKEAGISYARTLIILVTLVPALTYLLSRFWAFRAPRGEVR